MSNTVTTPNMNLTLPIPTVEIGPAWAIELNAALGVTGVGIDGHDHSAGKGVQITPSGLNLISDLTFIKNNATNLRSARLFPYTSSGSFAATASDLNAIYSITPDLYYIDGNGNVIQITKNGFVNSGAGSISGMGGYPNASASYVGSSGTFVWQQNINTAANMDSATLIVRYPGSYPTPSGNYVALQASSSLATGYSLTLPSAAPAATVTIASDSSGNLSFKSANLLIYDAVVGSAAQVTNKLANYSSITSAIAGVSSGQRIFVLPGTYTENPTINGETIVLYGSGQNTVISGNLSLTSATYCLIQNIKVTGTLTTDSASTGNIIENVFVAGLSSVTDGGSGNLLTLMAG